MKKGKADATTKAGANGHRRGEGFASSALREGAQRGIVLALQPETSLGTRETIHQVTKA